MSYFYGRHNLVTFNATLILSVTFFFFLLVSIIQPSIGHGDELEPRPLHELWSREELVQLAGYGEEKLSNVIVTGTLLCQACLQSHAQPEPRAWPISGALVAVECHPRGKWGKIASAQAVTDEYGDFLIDLPSHLHAIPNLEKACSVKVLQMPKKEVCRPAPVRKQMALTLSSFGNGIRDYSAGTIKLLHHKSKPLHACFKRTSRDKQIA